MLIVTRFSPEDRNLPTKELRRYEFVNIISKNTKRNYFVIVNFDYIYNLGHNNKF